MRIFGYGFVAFSSVAIAVCGFLVWGHHMFVSGQSVYASMVFSILSFFVAIPSAVKVFNWTATMYKGSVSYHAAMMYAMGFMGLFAMGAAGRVDHLHRVQPDVLPAVHSRLPVDAAALPRLSRRVPGAERDVDRG